MNVPKSLRDEAQRLLEADSGKVAAARLGVSRRTLYNVIGGTASARTIRKLAQLAQQKGTTEKIPQVA